MRESMTKLNTWVAALVLLLLAGPAAAQVPQFGPISGRLVDGGGSPLTGPVAIEIRLFDAETLGTEVFAESHAAVAIDATGNFTVQFGLGTPLRTTLVCPPSCDAAGLFLEDNRWIELVVGVEVLTPRIRVGAASFALVATQANRLVPDPTAPRFEDCGNGTVADHDTGLQWEQKTGTVGAAVNCDTVTCSDPHDVNNIYPLSLTAPADDGALFTDFLARLNGEFAPQSAAGCFAGHCDWELAKISQLQTILIGPMAAPGQAATCAAAPCIDPGFPAVGGGPTASALWYWSSSPIPTEANNAWFARFGTGDDGVDNGAFKTDDAYVRAVRTGSCY